MEPGAFDDEYDRPDVAEYDHDNIWQWFVDDHIMHQYAELLDTNQWHTFRNPFSNELDDTYLQGQQVGRYLVSRIMRRVGRANE